MFERLRKIFSETAKNLAQKSISKKDIDSILEELQISLMENDVAHEIVEEMTSKIREEMLDLKLERNENSEEVITTRLYSFLRELFQSTNSRSEIINSILEKKRSKAGPYTIIFLGINGTGKTTTVAKFCKLLRDNGISVVLAAADTHRAGAIEQIIQHGNNLNVKVITQRYGADPSAVARDALEHAKKNYIDTVLIDTAGRMQTSKNLMEEVSKIIRVIKPDMKIFVGDSLAGNDTVSQAREFFEYTKYDGSILTKSDADSKGGAAISIAYLTNKPILYLGMGQGYGDLEEFDHDKFLDSIFRNRTYDHTIKASKPRGVLSDEEDSKKDHVIGSTNMKSQYSDTKQDFQSSSVDKFIEAEKQEAEQTLGDKSTNISNKQKLINGKLFHDAGKEKKELTMKIKGSKSTGGSFFNNLFRDSNKNKIETDNSKADTIDNIKINQEMKKFEFKNKSKNKSKPEKEEKEKVVYLTDDDINDLVE